MAPRQAGAIPQRTAVATHALPETFDQLIDDMHRCEQAPGLSIWRHGELVAQRYAELVQHLQGMADERVCGAEPAGLGDWRLPDWLVENAELLLAKQIDFATAQRYQLFHDAGKPYCRTVDEAGRQHFPDHAAMSARVWRALGGGESEAALIERDMDIHQLSAAELPAFGAHPGAATLLLTGLAEVHANASMFGGLESISFKSKWKHLDRRGRALLKQWSQA